MSLALYVAMEGVSGGQLFLGAFGMLILLLVVWVVIRSPAINWIAWIIAGLAWNPGSFAGGTHLKTPLTFIELLFLRFANLSATGLSDIVPISSPSRVLVMLEQFTGVAYLAVVVSRLIGLTIVRNHDGGTS